MGSGCLPCRTSSSSGVDEKEDSGFSAYKYREENEISTPCTNPYYNRQVTRIQDKEVGFQN